MQIFLLVFSQLVPCFALQLWDADSFPNPAVVQKLEKHHFRIFFSFSACRAQTAQPICDPDKVLTSSAQEILAKELEALQAMRLVRPYFSTFIYF